MSQPKVTVVKGYSTLARCMWLFSNAKLNNGVICHTAERDIEILVSRHVSLCHTWRWGHNSETAQWILFKFWMIVAICHISRSYCAAILNRQILQELWDSVEFVFLKTANRLSLNFVGLLVTICSFILRRPSKLLGHFHYTKK